MITRGLHKNVEANPTLLEQAQASVFFVRSLAVLRTTVLDQRSVNIFHKGLGSKYCISGFAGHKVSVTPTQSAVVVEGSQRHRLNDQEWLASSTTVFTKADGWLDLACGLWLANRCL